MYLQEAARKKVERMKDPHRNDYADDNQAAYEKYVQRLVDRFIKGNDMLIDGQGHDAAKFIQEMAALNNYYHSLGATNVGMGTESMYLSQNELALNVPGMVELEGTTHFAKALGAEVVSDTKYGDMTNNALQAYVLGKQEGTKVSAFTFMEQGLMSSSAKVVQQQSPATTSGKEASETFNNEGGQILIEQLAEKICKMVRGVMTHQQLT